MKNLFIILALMVSFSASAKNKGFGLGVILGDPTGLSGKYFLGGNDAIDGGLAYGHHELILFGDYLRHFPGKFGRQNAFVANLTPYVGIGPAFAFGDGNDKHNHRFIHDDDDDFAFGGRIPLGAEWMAPDMPLGVSLEIVPGMVLIPETDAFVQGGLAVRYYFP